uniref:Squalene monooxygenase n=1 Tax=Zooxanthella nutricula TaxID=1333877 RepID=A0A7S2PJ42_9DINO
MGNMSPISRQARGAVRPFGICIVVGTTATGFDVDNSLGDLIYTNSDLWTGDVPSGHPDGGLGSPRKQYYWEAFPTGASSTERTTYLFTYMDAAAERPTVEQQLEDYWDLLPTYQRHNAKAFANGKSVEEAVASGEIQLKRVLYGCFPTYKDSPLPPPAARVLAVGDASGIQSPLSFGGFGALTRHLRRIADAVVEAIDQGALAREDLAAVNAYLPNQAATWMFQRAMMVPIGDQRPADFVNRLLRTNFQIMSDLGPEVLKPFNQDVVQPRPLSRVLVEAVKRDPLNTPLLVYHIGPLLLADWLSHFSAMLAFDLAHHALGPAVRAAAASLEEAGDGRAAFRLRRLAEQWEFGSGQDYKL